MKQVVFGSDLKDNAAKEISRAENESAITGADISPATPENPSTAQSILKNRNNIAVPNIVRLPFYDVSNKFERFRFPYVF